MLFQFRLFDNSSAHIDCSLPIITLIHRILTHKSIKVSFTFNVNERTCLTNNIGKCYFTNICLFFTLTFLDTTDQQQQAINICTLMIFNCKLATVAHKLAYDVQLNPPNMRNVYVNLRSQCCRVITVCFYSIFVNWLLSFV
jgi:hypothetical protein